MRETTIQKDLDSIWLYLRLKANYSNRKFEKPVEFHFRIRSYHDNGRFVGYGDYWRVFDMAIFSRENIEIGWRERKFGEEIYGMHDDESMEGGELRYLERLIDKALFGNYLRDGGLYEPMENYFYFSVQRKTVDKDASLCLNTYDFNFYFDENNMRMFNYYLKLKRRAISLNDRKIRFMFREGYLYREEREIFTNEKVFSIKNPEIENAVQKYRYDNSIENTGKIFKAIDKGRSFENKLIVNYRWVGNEIRYELVTSEGDENKKFLLVYTSYENFLEDKKNRNEMWKACAISITELLLEVCEYGENFDGISLNIGDNYNLLISKENLTYLWKRGYNSNFMF